MMRTVVAWSVVLMALFAGCTEGPDDASDPTMTEDSDPVPDPETQNDTADAVTPPPPPQVGEWHNNTFTVDFSRPPSGQFGDSCIYIHSKDQEPFTILKVHLIATWEVETGSSEELLWVVRDTYGEYSNETEPSTSPLEYHDESIPPAEEFGQLMTAEGEQDTGPTVQFCLRVPDDGTVVNQVVSIDASALVDGNVALSDTPVLF